MDRKETLLLKFKHIFFLFIAAIFVITLTTGCATNTPESIAVSFTENLFTGKTSKCMKYISDDMLESYGVSRAQFKRLLKESCDETMELYDSFKLKKVEVVDSYDDSYMDYEKAKIVEIRYTYTYKDDYSYSKVTNEDYEYFVLIKEKGKYKIVDF